MDPFLPCSSHHFESGLRPMVLARRSTQGTDRSTSSVNNGNSTTDTSTPTPFDMRPIPVRRSIRPRNRYVADSADGLIAGIHPILAWGRNHRSNTATTSSSNITPTGLQSTGSSDSMGHISNLSIHITINY